MEERASSALERSVFSRADESVEAAGALVAAGPAGMVVLMAPVDFEVPAGTTDSGDFAASTDLEGLDSAFCEFCFREGVDLAFAAFSFDGEVSLDCRVVLDFPRGVLFFTIFSSLHI
jgi:hypothetical protein